MDFGELIGRVRSWRRVQSGQEPSESLTYIKETINSVIKELISQEDNRVFQQRDVSLVTKAPLSDGSLRMTQGVHVATLVDTTTLTAFSPAEWDQVVTFAGEEYRVVSSIVGANTPAWVYLDRAAETTTTTGYTLNYDTLPLPTDLRRIEHVGIEGSFRRNVETLPLERFHREYDWREQTTGVPLVAAALSPRTSHWFTATTQAALAGRTIDLSEASWYYGIDNWIGRCIEIPATDAPHPRYRVVGVLHTQTTAVVSLEIDRDYSGTAAATVSLIDPRGSFRMRVYPSPDQMLPMRLRYLSSDYRLIGDDDVPAIPEDFHDAIWKGAIYYIAKFDGDASPEMVLAHRQDYLEARARLESYRSVDRAFRIQRRRWAPEMDVAAPGFTLPDLVEE